MPCSVADGTAPRLWVTCGAPTAVGLWLAAGFLPLRAALTSVPPAALELPLAWTDSTAADECFVCEF